MNELQLSDNLNQIEMEINYHKNLAGQSIWEIGRRLNHVKENDLVHGQFGKWLEHMNINQRVANQMMKVAKEIPNSSTYSNLGSRVLYEIATLPEDQKQQQLDRAEQGDAPTVRELRELKRKNREQEQRIKALENREPEKEVVEKKVEVVPEDYNNLKSDNQQLSKANADLNSKLKKLTSDLEFMQSKYNLLESNTREAKQLEETIKRLKGEKDRVQTMFDLSEKTKQINDFFDKEMASIRFKPLVDVIQTEYAFNELKETVSIVDHWVEEMREILPDTYIREAEIVEE